MSNEVNTSKSRYIKIDGKKILVTEEVYKTYYRPIWALHDKQRNHGCCTCTDWRDCTGDCGTCRFQVAGDTSSIEALTEEIGDHADFLASDEDGCFYSNGPYVAGCIVCRTGKARSGRTADVQSFHVR